MYLCMYVYKLKGNIWITKKEIVESCNCSLSFVWPIYDGVRKSRIFIIFISFSFLSLFPTQQQDVWGGHGEEEKAGGK